MAARHGVRAEPGADHERVAAGPLARRGAAGRAGRPRARRGPDLRPRASHHRPPSWRAVSAADGRRRPRSGRDRAARLVPLHDPDLPEPERPHAFAGAPPRPRRAARGGQGARSSRTTPTRSSATRARRCPAIYELTGGEGVVYSFSFSKIVAPGAPCRVPGRERRTLIARLENARRSDLPDSGAPAAGDRVRVREPGAARRERRARRRDAARAARRDARGVRGRELPEGTSWSKPQGGYFTWLDLPEGTDAGALLDVATAPGRHLREGERLLPGRPRRRELSSACVQLRLARRLHRRDRPPCRPSSRVACGAGGGIAARPARRRSIRPPTAPAASRSAAPSRSRRRSATRTRWLFSTTNAISQAITSSRTTDLQVEHRLPRRGVIVRVGPGLGHRRRARRGSRGRRRRRCRLGDVGRFGRAHVGDLTPWRPAARMR